MKKTALALACLALTLGCGDDPPDGGGGRRDAGGDGDVANCADTLVCVDACTHPSCVANCLDDASPRALAQIEALLTCSQLSGCGADSGTCLDEACATEVTACLEDLDVVRDGGTDAGSDADTEDPFPARIVGTTRDYNPLPGTGIVIDSNATVTFVRDEAAGEAAGFPSSELVFYRLEHIAYRATQSGSDGTCSHHADESETFTNPSAFENNLVIERTPDESGQHPYVVSTTLSVSHPNALTVTCPPGIPSTTAQFNAEHNISHGPGMTHLTDGAAFVSTATVGWRQLSWDLHAAD